MVSSQGEMGNQKTASKDPDQKLEKAGQPSKEPRDAQRCDGGMNLLVTLAVSWSFDDPWSPKALHRSDFSLKVDAGSSSEKGLRKDTG